MDVSKIYYIIMCRRWCTIHLKLLAYVRHQMEVLGTKLYHTSLVLFVCLFVFN